MELKGRLTAWNDDKGFGFISPADGGPRVFAHISAFPRGRRPTLNRRVTYTARRDRQNRWRADQVRYSGWLPGRSRVAGGVLLALIIAVIFFGGLAALVLAGMIPLLVPGFYGAASLIAMALYWRDKRAAGAGEQRTAESTLHGVELIGGWPGALIAQQAFRHKTRKTGFQLVFWLNVVANIGGLMWLLFAGEAGDLRQRLGIDMGQSLAAVLNSF